MRWLAAVGLCSLVLAAGRLSAAADAEALVQQAQQIFGVLPAEAQSDANPLTPAKIDLGRMLYYDARLSPGQGLSCNGCHDLARYGGDHAPASPGHRGERPRNAPATYNAALQFAQLWDGRAPSVEDAAAVLDGAPEVLRAIPGYQVAFRAAFPEDADPIVPANAARALGAFQRRLVTPARFDRFVQGDTAALTSEEQQGLQTFIATGCPGCHHGATVGGQMFQKLGVVEPYPTEDRGRAAVSGNPADEYVFKVPSLRNVAETAPYFHDGSVETLDMAVRLMARFQIGRTLTDEETASIVAFLRSLTGELPKDTSAPPELPPSGAQTPGPDGPKPG